MRKSCQLLYLSFLRLSTLKVHKKVEQKNACLGQSEQAPKQAVFVGVPGRIFRNNFDLLIYIHCD